MTGEDYNLSWVCSHHLLSGKEIGDLIIGRLPSASNQSAILTDGTCLMHSWSRISLRFLKKWSASYWWFRYWRQNYFSEDGLPLLRGKYPGEISISVSSDRCRRGDCSYTRHLSSSERSSPHWASKRFRFCFFLVWKAYHEFCFFYEPA